MRSFFLAHPVYLAGGAVARRGGVENYAIVGQRVRRTDYR